MKKDKNTGEVADEMQVGETKVKETERDFEVDCEQDTCGYFMPPLPSRATRNVLKPSRNSSRGFLLLTFPSDDWPRVYTYESILEKCFLILMWLRADVQLIQDQPPLICYVDDNGKTRNHIFDFLVVRTSGERVAVAIKPQRRVEKLNFERELELIADAMPKTFADRVLLVTDKDLDKNAANQTLRDLMLTNRKMIGGAK